MVISDVLGHPPGSPIGVLPKNFFNPHLQRIPPILILNVLTQMFIAPREKVWDLVLDLIDKHPEFIPEGLGDSGHVWSSSVHA